MTRESFRPGPIACEGAVFGDFELTSHLPPDAAPAAIERDRLHMAARPGFNRKILPLLIESGRSALWLLHDDRQHEISLVTIAERALDADNDGLDYNSIQALGAAASHGAHWDRDGLARSVHDRTYWVFTIWFPRVEGADLESPVWPNSPPLPAP